jgi:hypothetical protein
MFQMTRFTTKNIALCAVLMCANGLFLSQNAQAQSAVPRAQMQAMVSQAPADAGLSAAGDKSLIGMGRLRVFGFQIYDATLRAQSDFRADNYERETLSLEVAYLRDFDNVAIADRSLKEMQKLASFTESQAAQWLARMTQIFPDVKKGDRLLAEYTPEQGIRFVLNGKPIGEVREPEFARLFIGIWLSPRTSEPQLRRELLGLNSR